MLEFPRIIEKKRLKSAGPPSLTPMSLKFINEELFPYKIQINTEEQEAMIEEHKNCINRDLVNMMRAELSDDLPEVNFIPNHQPNVLLLSPLETLVSSSLTPPP